jgi:hypothetical protein
VIALAAPTRVSPAPATEQKQHQKNNQYGFHRLYLTCKGKLGLTFVTTNLISSLHIMLQVAKTYL